MLDVVVLHGFLFEQILGITPEAVTAGQHVRYYKDPAIAATDLESGSIQAAFFLNPVTVEEFRMSVAETYDVVVTMPDEVPPRSLR